MKELIYWIWLSLAVTPASETFKKLITKYETPRAIYECSDSQIAAVISSKSKDYSALTRKDLKRAEEVLDFCESKGVGILLYSDENYPELLRKIKNPPVLLYYRGVLPDFNSDTFVSVVGTRRLSDYGREYAYKIAYDLALSGATIVSGMAIGVDGVALAGAIAAGKPTVAVIGSGIDICYPDVHLTLAREIVKCGCVITEYPPKSKPDKINFPRRNRIISGLSIATVVIEGNERSGAIITARCANEQGRTVYALPGNVNNRLSIASSLLIKSGARLLTAADDIVLDFDKTHPGRLNPFLLTTDSRPDMFSVLRRLRVSCVTPSDDIFKPSRQRNKRVQAVSEPKEQNPSNNESLLSGLDSELVRLYNKIPSGEAVSVEALVDTQTPLSSVMSGILNLEIAGLVAMLPGDKVKRN